MRTLVLATFASLLVLSQADADGLLYRLSADGVFVRFDVEMKMEAGGMEKTIDASLSMASVGQKTVDNQKCRWIEFKFVMKVPGKERSNLAKVLIPEKYLKAGATPLDHAVKGWLKERNQAAEELKDFKGKKAGPLPIFLSGPLDNLKKLKAEKIDSQLGKLACAGATGTKQYEQEGEKIDVTFENRFNDKAPFGVVTARIQFKVKRNGNARESGTLTLRLAEVGKNAKSELPD